MNGTTRYEVRDATGMLVAIHERIEDEDGGKLLRWRDAAGRMGLGGTPLVDLPLYGAQRIGDWGSRTIAIVEGEKAAQALVDVGVPALGTVTGASATPSRQALAELSGCHVVLWPDSDPPGKDGKRLGDEHMLRVAKALDGIAASVRWVTWGDAPPHGDAADFILGEKGAKPHTAAEAWDLLDAAGDVPTNDVFERRGLGYFARVDGAELSFDRLRWATGDLFGELTVRHDGQHLTQTKWNASTLSTRANMAKGLKERAPSLRVDWATVLEDFSKRVLAVEREGEPFKVIGRQPRRPAIPYLLHPMLPEGKPTILYGPGASGKSTLAGALVVSVASGEPVVDGWRIRQPVRALVLDFEADGEEWNDRIALIAKGAGIDAPEVDYRFCGGRSFVDQVEDVSRYVTARKVGLVVVDSVGMASPTNREGSDANESVIRLFRAIRHLRITTLLIDHVTGADLDADKSSKPYGSVYKVNLARSTWEMRRGDDTPVVEGEPLIGHAAVYHRKSNDSAKAAPFGVRFEYADDYWRIDREPIADDALSAGMPLDRQIVDALRDGPLTPKEISDVLGANRGSVRKILTRFDGQKFTHLDGGRWGLCYVAA